jgi:uncharacterized repeat protein (TIGR01451 family)
MKTSVRISTGLLLSFLSFSALAQIEVSTRAETEVVNTGAAGEKIVKRIDATTVVPGAEVIYTINARNTGSDPAKHVVVTNPVPQSTVYVDGSAAGDNTDIMFSVDGGKSYAHADKLTVRDENGKPRKAEAADYTNVRWTLRSALQPSQLLPVWYRVKVK